jgi:hypothetical protein
MKRNAAFVNKWKKSPSVFPAPMGKFFSGKPSLQAGKAPRRNIRPRARTEHTAGQTLLLIRSPN